MASTDVAVQNPDLGAIFLGLRNKNQSIRIQSAVDLRRYVSTSVAEMTSDAAARLWDNTINRNIFELIHSANPNDQLGGLLAIDNLLDQGGEDIERNRNLFRFYNYVKSLLPNADINIMLAASKTLGQIAKNGGTTFGDSFMVMEVPSAIELLLQDSSRYAGILILKELARNSAAYFHVHISLVFDKIMIPLRDTRIIVREGAAELLAACLDIVTKREKAPGGPYLTRIALDAANGMKAPQVEILHGSLLIYRTLLTHGGSFMRESYLDVSTRILNMRSHKDPIVRRMVITLIPTLASFDKQAFCENSLHVAAAHLIAMLDKPQERSFAFIALGHMAVSVGAEIRSYLENIMNHIKNGFAQRGKKNAPAEEPLFQCIGMLAQAVGQMLTKLLHEQLDLMFAGGLNEPLRQALVAIEEHVKPLRRPIQDRLLDMLSMVLSGQPYRPLGAPVTIRPETNGTHSTAQVPGAVKNPELIILALDTLGSFNFKGHALNEMARSCVLPYLEDDVPDVRRSAAITCCSLFVNDPILYHVSNRAIEVISDVVDKLLVVGIADPDPTIRQTVLSSLHDRFDKHLAQAENVRSLFIALNDEVFENRLTAVTLIGRLATHNPAYVMPSLRKALIQLLTELEYSTVQRHREECTHLLMRLVGSTHRLIKPYAIPMLKVLLPKAGDENVTVASYIILCLGELVNASGEDALPLVPDLMAVIMPRLADTSLPKRDAALITLGKVCANTSYVIDPLIEYPEVVGLLGRILKSEAREDVKREVIRVFGVLGAIDPFRRNRKPFEESKTPSKAILPAIKDGGLSAGADDYYQKVAIQTLLGILKDPSLNTHHHGVIEAIMSMFKTQGLKCVAFLPQIIPAFTSVARNSAARVQDFHLQQLAILVDIIKQHVRGFMTDIVALITDLWENPLLQLPLVSLIGGLGRALDTEFKPFFPKILPLLLKVFDGEINDKNEKKTQVQIKIFDAFFTFGSSIEEYMHLVIPIIVRTYERSEAPLALRKRGVQTIDGLSRKVNFSDHASRIIHPLVRVMRNCVNELWVAVMDCLCSLVTQLGADFAIFIPIIQKTLHSSRMTHAKYENLISKLLNGERLPRDVNPSDAPQASDIKLEDRPAESTKLTVNQQHLKQAWDITQTQTREEWRAWLHRLGVELMRESPSHALRACMSLVDAYPPLARDLFNAAFISCWGELYDQYQEDLVRALEHAMISPEAPSELVLTLLNLAEFMEHEEKSLPFEARVLGEYSAKFNAWAKALHYRELQYFQDASLPVMEALIGINTKLQQQDSAWGVLITAREQYNTSGHEEWYEKLGRWHNALGLYQEKLDQDPNRQDAIIGRMRCLHALGEWDQLSLDIGEYWDMVSHDERREMAPMAAAAAWSLNDWHIMKKFVEHMSDDLADKAFYNAIYQVHDNNFVKAHASIDRARDLLEPDMVAVVGEGYGRSYNVMVRAQMLSELEEIMTYRKSADQPERQATMRKTWMKRIVGCQPDVDVWQRVLQVRSLVLKPEDDSHMWIKFANLCRKNKRMVLAEKSIGSLLPRENVSRDHVVTRAAPHVVYAQLKFLWAQGAQERAHSISALLQFTENLSRDLAGRTERQPSHALPSAKMQELSVLLSKCYLKLGEWQVEVGDDWGRRNAQDILHSYLLATRFDSSSYKAWHTWALANFELVSYLDSHQDGRVDDTPSDSIAGHVVQAISGFFRSIQLRSDNTLQDILRLLTLWFKYGAHDDVSHAMSNGFAVVEVDTWLEVIPQIIARIQTPSANVRRTISSLLTDIGKVHPQAMVYPLTVASKSSSIARKHAAEEIMQRMREHSPVIVEQAMLVSEELIRVAILWHEMWHEGLEEASRLYFTEHNPEAMIAVLEPLHNVLEAGPSTARETSFFQVFGRDLCDAREACRRYRTYGDHQELEHAWDIYYGVFKKIEKQLPQLMNLDLQYVSPDLLAAKDLELVVPGTYKSGVPITRISKFSSKLSVIASKQRPRKVSLTGEDGRVYEYGLKGHEDLRQDERVMQLFSLVNDLLVVDSECFKRRLNIRRYPIIPLAPNVGLFGWVQESDTLHVLVRDYRDARKVLINIEYRLMLQMSPDYENLTLIQKCEVFEYALENTTGQDLYRVLWFKSDNSEHWLERRTIYTRSLAVNSMVGHILGLGDRHPSNLLLERKSGKVVHIDFGDCFEVAMHREKFPEKIPFRLTRMLTNAMEVSGIIGSFKITCVNSMRVLRENKESLLAVLEAFVYDPLINWRLMQHDMEGRRPEAVAPTQTANPRQAEQLMKVTAHPQGVNKKLKADENEIFNDGMGDPAMREEVRNHRALAVYKRVEAKLTGRDFDPLVQLDVEHQVDRLIQQATSIENLCQCFSGWCAFW